MKDPRPIVKEVCDLMQIVVDTAYGVTYETSSNEMLDNITDVLDTIENNINTLSEDEMVNQYPEEMRDGFVVHLKAIRRFIKSHRSSIQCAKDRRWMESMGVI